MPFTDLARPALLESAHVREACVGVSNEEDVKFFGSAPRRGGSGDQRENAFKSRRQPSDVFGVAVFGEAIFLFRPGAGAACPQVNAGNTAPRKYELRRDLRRKTANAGNCVEGNRRQFSPFKMEKNSSPF